MNKKYLIIIRVIASIMLLGFLSIANNSYAEFSYYGENQGGFGAGLWDGIKSPITVPLNVFFESVNVYNADNNGFMYNLGFFIPALLLCEFTIPLFILAWIIKIIFFIILFILALVFRK